MPEDPPESSSAHLKFLTMQPGCPSRLRRHSAQLCVILLCDARLLRAVLPYAPKPASDQQKLPLERHRRLKRPRPASLSSSCRRTWPSFDAAYAANEDLAAALPLCLTGRHTYRGGENRRELVTTYGTKRTSGNDGEEGFPSCEFLDRDDRTPKTSMEEAATDGHGPPNRLKALRKTHQNRRRL